MPRMRVMKDYFESDSKPSECIIDVTATDSVGNITMYFERAQDAPAFVQCRRDKSGVWRLATSLEIVHTDRPEANSLSGPLKGKLPLPQGLKAEAK